MNRQKKQEGANIQDIKQKNRMLVLKLIATGSASSRVELARATGLSKMAIGNIVSEFLAQNILDESVYSAETEGVSTFGRPPIMLKISDRSPRICGMLIKRGLCQVILSNLSGKIFASQTTQYSGNITVDYLLDTLLKSYRTLVADFPGKIMMVGISSIGPLNIATGEILNPPNFYNIANVKIVEIMEARIGLPTYLINDANAGALAELLYGSSKSCGNFIYLHIMNGIGSGLVLEDKLFNGNFGQSGEIGHTSISFAGPQCSCGNTGCLDLYANIKNMQKKANQLAPLYPESPLTKIPMPSWNDFIDFANRHDALAIAVLDEFCQYISYALIDVLNLLDVSKVIVGYDSTGKGDIIEKILASKISPSVLYSKYREVQFIHSSFSGDAPLIGSIAVVAERVFGMGLENWPVVGTSKTLP